MRQGGHLKKLSQQKTANKKLLKAGIVGVYALVYVPLLLFLPDAIIAQFGIDIQWLQAAIKVLAAIILLVPSFVIAKKLSYLH